jgi:hypothetical protein
MLKVCENRVLKSVLGSKRDEVTLGSRKLENEEHYNLYSSRNIIRMTNSKMI